jgi:hypothetical protein
MHRRQCAFLRFRREILIFTPQLYDADTPNGAHSTWLVSWENFSPSCGRNFIDVRFMERPLERHL